MSDEQKLELYKAGTVAQFGDISLRRDPSEVVDEAVKAAKALQRLVDNKPPEDKLVLNDKTYIKAEDWSAIGGFYGCVGRIDRSEYVSLNTADGRLVVGFKSYGAIVHIESGKVISTGEAMCLSDEEKWSTRPKYAWAYVLKTGEVSVEEPANVWAECELEPTGKTNASGKSINRPKKKRVLIGEDTVPLFQMMSMSQTRALNKAFVNAFRWHVVLAGYAPTPAEEMDDALQHVIDVKAEKVLTTTKAPPPATKSKATTEQTKPPAEPTTIVHPPATPEGASTFTDMLTAIEEGQTKPKPAANGKPAKPARPVWTLKFTKELPVLLYDAGTAADLEQYIGRDVRVTSKPGHTKGIRFLEEIEILDAEV